MRVAITGATGFLGRYLIEVLSAAGHQCRGLTRSQPPGTDIEWVIGSLSNEASLRALVADTDAVVHAALDHPGGNFTAENLAVVPFVEANLIGTIRLIEAARNAQVGRFVVISSGAVHDDILRDRPLDETHPLWPRSHYGATKAAIEAFVHSYGRGCRFPIAALRPTSIYGIDEPVTRSRWYDLVATVVRGEDVTTQRGGKQVHARDVARATELLLRTPKPIAGEIYHCTDRFVAEFEIAQRVKSFVPTRGVVQGEAPLPRNPIRCEKLKQLGMTFGGEPLLDETIKLLIQTAQSDQTTTGPE